MPNIIILLSSLLLATLASEMSLLGFDMQTPITIQKLRCLQSKYLLEETYIQLYNDGDIISSINEELLEQVFIEPHAIIILLPTDTFSSEWAILKWQQHILTHNYKSLWISWTYGGGGYKIDCLGVWNILAAFQKLSSRVGIFMSQEKWEDNQYLNKGYCNNLSRFPLFEQNIGEFKPYNNWSSYALKVEVIASGICQIDRIDFVREKS